MNDLNNILTELQTLSSTVFNVPKQNVYKVPTDYFATILPQFEARLAVDNAFITAPTLIVPDGYFENLSNNILQKIKLTELDDDVVTETNNISSIIAAIGTLNTYKVPNNYFDTLAPAASLFNNQVYNEILVASPTIASIGNNNVYTVPQGYFKSSIQPIAKPAKVVSINKVTKFFKYAAAAVVAGILGVTIMNVTTTQSNTNTVVTPTYTAAIVKSGNQIIATNSFDETLASLSDNEIEQFLQQSGQDVEAALVASSTDDATLPDATDYLLDENTLETYLKENNLKTSSN